MRQPVLLGGLEASKENALALLFVPRTLTSRFNFPLTS
jgi:hypothetical protein